MKQPTITVLFHLLAFLDQGSETSSYWVFNNIIFYNNSQRTVGSYHDRFKDNFQSIGRYQISVRQSISLTIILPIISQINFGILAFHMMNFQCLKILLTAIELSDASPMIGSGLSSLTSGSLTKNISSKDILGNLRPNPTGSNPDLGAYENSLSVSPYPNKINNLTAVPRSKSALLSWSPDTSSDLKQYNIYQSTNGDFSSFLDTIASTKDTSFIAFNLINGTEFHFWVTAVDTAGFEGQYPIVLLQLHYIMDPIGGLIQQLHNQMVRVVSMILLTLFQKPLEELILVIR